MPNFRGKLRLKSPRPQGIVLACAFAFCTVNLGLAASRHSPRSSEAMASLPGPEANGTLPWSWYYAQTPRQVQDLVGTDNRLVSIQVKQASPLLLDVAIVSNTGTGHKNWWWVPNTGPDMTGAQLGEYSGFREGRTVSLAPYVIKGTTYFAAILINNTGSDYKTWWWYFDTPKSNINALLSQNNARLVDLRSYPKDGVTLYAFVMIPNTGADESAWWWYTALTPASTRANMKDNKAVLTSLQPTNATGATYDVVMNATGAGTMPAFQGVSWMWATNDTD
jgi:hypothetical protein